MHVEMSMGMIATVNSDDHRSSMKVCPQGNALALQLKRRSAPSVALARRRTVLDGYVLSLQR